MMTTANENKNNTMRLRMTIHAAVGDGGGQVRKETDGVVSWEILGYG
jgi:hypothetical protein